MNREKFGFAITKDKSGKDIYARSENQLKFTKLIDENQIIFCDGAAGTGKTFLAVAKAVQLLKSDRGYERIVLTRPAVESGESLGFLPGELDEKIAPYMTPLYDYIGQLVSNKRNKVQGDYPSKYKKKKEKQIAEGKEVVVDYNEFVKVVPLAFMRGMTFNNSIVLVDEAQNISKKQMLMLLTRLGHNSKMIITGDQTQRDTPDKEKSALIDAMNRLDGMKQVAAIQFDKSDVMRNDLIQEILDRYDLD